MTKNMTPIKQHNKWIKQDDDFQTPPSAIEPLIYYLRRYFVEQSIVTVWEPACGHGNLVEAFKAKDGQVIGTDIHDPEKHDFLKWAPKYSTYDIIITNPPYSQKNEFLKRAYEIGKPFAFLLPLTTFETELRQNLMEKYYTQIIFFNGRVQFETPGDMNERGVWFATAWFTYGLNLPNQINFYKRIKKGGKYVKG